MTRPHSKTFTESLVESLLDTGLSQHAQAERSFQVYLWEFWQAVQLYFVVQHASSDTI